MGSSGINQTDYNHNINVASLASLANPINGITTNTAANAAARTPYLGFQANGLQQNGFDGIYNYNSLQTTVRKSFSRGLSFQAVYTWSKNLSDVGFDAANINRSTDLAQQYGPTPFSRPHRFVVSYQYELPFKANGILNKFVQGWGASGLTTIQSGTPLTLFDNRAGSAYGTPGSGTVEQGMSRAQICPGFTYDQVETSGNVKDRLNNFFNASAFTCGPPAIQPNGSVTTLALCPTCATLFGNTGVGIVRGPHQLNFDFSLIKITRISERQSLQFRAEFFNLFNHAQFAIPAYSQAPNQFVNNGTLFANATAAFGVINQTSVAPRLIQLGLRYQF